MSRFEREEPEGAGRQREHDRGAGPASTGDEARDRLTSSEAADDWSRALGEAKARGGDVGLIALIGDARREGAWDRALQGIERMDDPASQGFELRQLNLGLLADNNADRAVEVCNLHNARQQRGRKTHVETFTGIGDAAVRQHVRDWQDPAGWDNAVAAVSRIDDHSVKSRDVAYKEIAEQMIEAARPGVGPYGIRRAAIDDQRPQKRELLDKAEEICDRIEHLESIKTGLRERIAAARDAIRH